MPFSTALEDLISYLSPELKACNQEILNRIDSPVPLINQLGFHLVSAGGKRIRPLLLLAAARLAGYNVANNPRRDVSLAACVEFIHTATLLHDDVIDKSMLRRGEKTANALFGNKASILVGDFLFARAFEMMTDADNVEIMRILAVASSLMAQGEVEQMSIQNDLSTSIDQYLNMIFGKTAALFVASAEVGAVVAGAGIEQRDALRDYGGNLGMAFQLADDALDYSGDTEELGKTIGDDLMEGKITLPILVAYHKGDDQERAFWKRVIETEDRRDDDLEKAGTLIKKRGAIDVTLEKAKEYADKASAHLDVFENSDLKTILGHVPHYAIYRKN